MNAPARGGGQAPVRLGLAFRPPETLLPLLADEPFTLLLHGAGQGERGRFSRLFAFPDFTIQTRDGREGLDAMRARFRPSPAPGFTGGYAGLMAYDMGEAIERVPGLPDALSDWPALAMGWYSAQVVFDHAGRAAWVEGLPGPARRLHRALSATPRALEGFGVEQPLSPVWPEARYLDSAARAREYVRAGDVFQVNLSHPYRGRLMGADAPAAIFARLAAQSPAAFAGFFRLDAGRVIVTNSPERFVQVFADGRVQTRPIKGTRPRGRDPEGDAALAAELKASGKDRAENLMIVDLMRNDLARVCAPGSVTVPELFEVESFSNVHHLVSTVEGRLDEGRTALDLVEAAFPPGSITGAPKPRAMEIIAELEGERRGPYCGALGWMGSDGAADLNVMIRTAAFVRDGGAWDVEARSGGAITIDSVPEAELAETRAKISALARAMEPGS